MAVIATDVTRLSNLVKMELAAELAYCREVVVANEAVVKSYALGTVLGKVTATGKYKICVQNAADGSQTAAGIVIAAKDVPATTDTKVLVLSRGPATVSKAGLVLDASFDLQAEKDALYAVLEAAGIQVLDAV